MKPVLTIALPVHNGGKALQLAIRSILNQTFSDWELILIDDGSTDEAVENISYLNDKRIFIVRDGENKGLASRLNEAIDLSRGKYFARMDHDDICHPQRFEKQIKYLELHEEVDLLATRSITINESEKIIGVLPGEEDHEDICRHPWKGFYMPHPTWMGKTSWFKRNRYKDNPAPYRCEDQELLLRANKNSQFHCLSEKLLAYRVRENFSWKKQYKTRIDLMKHQVKYFFKKNQYWFVMLSILMCLARILLDIKNKMILSIKPINSRVKNKLIDELEIESWNKIFSNIKSIS